MSFIAIYVTFAPLSLVAPVLVDAMLFDESSIMFRPSGPDYLVANSVDFLAIVVLAPIGEELLFRGVLLTRWSHIWNPRLGSIASSIAFAVLHPNQLGSFVFGLIAAELYTRNRSLLAPIIFHATNNLIAWFLDVASAYALIPVSLDGASQLPGAWWLPVAGAIVMLPWLPGIRRTGGLRFGTPPHAA